MPATSSNESRALTDQQLTFTQILVSLFEFAASSISSYGQGTEKTAVSLSTATKTQRTVSHKASSHVNGQRVFHTGSDEMIFYTVCVDI